MTENFQELVKNSPILSEAAKVSADLGIKTWAVGGFVRDLLLGITTNETDFVCLGENSGILMAEELAKRLNAGKVTVYKNFGTAGFNHGNHNLEFIAARKESYRAESRKPEIEPGTIEDDQKRRDFTINALAISLNKEDLGSLIDPFGGIEHLNKRTIKTPLDPDITFSDDPLRMMRAIRFACRLGFDIEADTFNGIINNAERIKIVSAERITDELNKIILTKKPSYGFKLLYHAGLLNIIFPEMIELLGAENMEGKTHKDNFYHTLEVLDNVALASDDLWTRWSAILHDIAKPATKRFDPKVGFTFHGHEEKGARMVPEIFRRMKLPLNDKMKKVKLLVRLHLRPIALVKEEVTDAAVRRLMFEAGKDLEDLMKLCKADITTKNPNRAKRYLQNFSLVEQKMKEVEQKDQVRNFKPVITGEILMEVFNLKAGPEVGKLKTEIRQALLDGTVENNLEPALLYTLEVGKKFQLLPTNSVEYFVSKYYSNVNHSEIDTLK